MASFITRLLARFKHSKSAHHQAERKRRGRRLLMETMEQRQLLAGDIATISGTAFVDLTDNGFDGADTPVVGATVRLYNDVNSDGQLDGGDTLITTDVTDANGEYAFADLVAGDYIVEQVAFGTLLQRAANTTTAVTISEAQASGVAVLNVDNFNSTAQSLTANTGTPVDESVTATAGSEALGDERDVVVNYASGPGNITAQVNTGTGLLSINTDASTEGNVIITYDGVDGSAATVGHNLGGIDLTQSDAAAFHFLAGSEAGNTITIDVFSNATDFSTLTVPLPVTPGAAATENMIIRYSDFVADAGGAGANFASVSAIRIQIDMAPATDAQFEFTQVVAPFVDTQNFQNLNPMSLGNLVFADVDNDGVLDAGETGIANVDVELYSDTNSNGSFDNGIDTLLATTTTNATGNYSFGGLLPGEYIAVIPISEFATAADPLFGFASSTGNDPAPDPDIAVIDNDDNGTLIAGVGVATAAITLASGSEPTNDGDTDPNSNNTLDFGFAPEINLRVLKVADAASVIAGNQVTYTLTVSNQGDATANNVVITDDLPDFLVIDSITAPNGGVVVQTGNAAGEIEVTYASLAAAQQETITIVATIPAAQAAATAVVNTATITGDGIETDASDNTATANIDITRQAVLQISKTDTPDPAAVGQELTYTIIVSNNGPSTATNVVISDTLPAGLTFTDVETTQGTASQAGGVITVNVPSLAVAGSVTVTVTATIQSTFAGSTLTNAATADADEADQVSTQADTTVNPVVDLQITKSDSVDPVNRGSQLTYTLNVTNAGPSGATNVEVVDTLPAGVTFVSATGGTVTPPGGGSSDVVVALGNIASGGTAQVTITVDVLQSAAATITNTAIVRSTESLAGFDSNTANNTATEPTATQGVIDLAITKADSADPVVPGEALTYTLVVTNNGPSDATDVTVADDLPDGIRITSASSTVGTVTIPASAQDTTAANNDDLTVAVGNLASGASATITINAIVLAATTGTLTNTATVSTTATSLTDSNPNNNSDSETTTLSPEIDLRITKTDGTDPTIAGNSLVYTIIVTNDGPSTATNVALSDTLPAGVTFTSAQSTRGTVTHNAGVVSGDLGTLQPGESATITLTVGVNASTRGTLTNTASVTATQTETDTTNNSATATTTINASVDLAVTKTDGRTSVAAGGNLTYTIVVTNNGVSEATNVQLTDNLPASLSFTSGSTTVGTLTNTGNNVTVNIGTLAVGASATITLNAGVLSTATGTISNTATVTATETDTATANNSATDTTSIAVPGSIAGNVYVDADRDGVRDASEAGIAGVTITLTGTDLLGASVNRTTTTNAQGEYQFANLLPGTYTLTQTQPAGFFDGATNVGTPAGGTAGTNTISTITLESGQNAVAYNFGERLSQFSKRRFLASSTVNS